MSRGSPGVVLARLLAFAVATAAVLVPVGAMVVASFRDRVVDLRGADLRGGVTVRVAGHFTYERSLAAIVMSASRDAAPDGVERDAVDLPPGLVEPGDLRGTMATVGGSLRPVAENSATRVWLDGTPWTRAPAASDEVLFSAIDGDAPARPGSAINVVRFQMAPADDPDGELTPVSRKEKEVVGVRERWSTAHYEDVWGSAARWTRAKAMALVAWLSGKSSEAGPQGDAPRTVGLLWHSLVLAGGAAVLALLLGLPIAWHLARTEFLGRRLLGVLLAGPLLLPPFFAAMGISGSIGAGLEKFGVDGAAEQLICAVLCLGGLLAPVPALLVGRALASVPAGLCEAAMLQGGPRAVRKTVVWPSIRPAVAASFTLAFVVALCDFSVPDLIGALMRRGNPVHVFATEIFLQWGKLGNAGRATATGAPFLVLVLLLLALAVRWLKRGPAGFLGGATRTRPLVRLAGSARPWLVAAPALLLGFLLPIGSVIAWGFSPARVPTTIRETVGLMDDAARWLRLGLLAAIVATATAVVLARAVLRGGRGWRPFVASVVALPLAVPGMVLMVGTVLVWVSVPTPPGTLWKGTLVLVGRFLPHAVVAVLFAVRAVEPRLEEAARLLGAGPLRTATRVWGPLSARGIAAAFFLVLVFALRELDGIVLIEPGILPVRIYDKVHYGRTGAVADLSMAYLGVLLVPALLAAALWRRRGTGGDRPS